MAEEREFEGVSVTVPLDALLTLVALAKRQLIADCIAETLHGEDHGTEASAHAINEALETAGAELRQREAAMAAERAA